MRVRVSLDTVADINEFVGAVTKVDANVTLTDKDRNFIVNGKSLLGAMYTAEWEQIWCESDKDIYSHIQKFVMLES
ncbi:MAG: hypothetical protein WCQ72_00965 [Eubacteriales bacterium]